MYLILQLLKPLSVAFVLGAVIGLLSSTKTPSPSPDPYPALTGSAQLLNASR